MDSPPPKVFYKELPESPVKVFYGQTSLGAQDVSTPRRKTRTARGVCPGRKCPHSESKEEVNSGSRIPDRNPCPDILPAFVETTFLDDNYFGNKDNDGSNVCALEVDKVEWHQKMDLAYASFVGAVLSDECSFYQLSKKIFVANGWNPVKNETNV
jgi:hypothetical protein